MTATLTITLDDEVLDALRKSGSVQIKLAAGDSKPARGTKMPRSGSLGARVIEWAEKRGKSFRGPDVAKRFKLSRAHASMLVSRLANGPYAIERERRGVYSFAGAGRRRRVAKRK